MQKYSLCHTYKERLLVPLVGLTPNIKWILNKEEPKMVVTSDNIEVLVKSWCSIHILSEEGMFLVKDIYKMDIAPFLLKWYNALNIDSLEFLYLELNNR